MSTRMLTRTLITIIRTRIPITKKKSRLRVARELEK